MSGLRGRGGASRARVNRPAKRWPCRVKRRVPLRMPSSGSSNGRQVPRSRPRAIIAVGDGALELGIVDRVVLDVDRHALVGGTERRPFRHRPAPQHASVLQPEVPMQPGPVRGVLLHDEDRLWPGRDIARRRLRHHGEVALGPVAAERGVRHGIALISRWAEAVYPVTERHDRSESRLQTGLLCQKQKRRTPVQQHGSMLSIRPAAWSERNAQRQGTDRIACA